jgi:hypothetical protein
MAVHPDPVSMAEVALKAHRQRGGVESSSPTESHLQQAKTVIFVGDKRGQLGM